MMSRCGSATGTSVNAGHFPFFWGELGTGELGTVTYYGAMSRSDARTGCGKPQIPNLKPQTQDTRAGHDRMVGFARRTMSDRETQSDKR